VECKLKESNCNSVRTLLGLLSEEIDDNHIWYFRGHANKLYVLEPSIYRNKRWSSNEDDLIREILIRCPNDFSSASSSFEKLVKMQHYDLPTRLLDLTQNPLVALYFSCIGLDEKDDDGEIIFFKIPKKEIKYFDSDTVSVISNLAWAKTNFEVHKTFFNDFHDKNNLHAQKLMHDIRREKPHFTERINTKHIESVVCVKPKLDNPRVIRQDGAFLLFGINSNKSQCATFPQDWIFSRFTVKAKEKEKILRQLASIGISKAKLFPEIDMVSQFIKNDYGLNEIKFESNVKDYKSSSIDLMFKGV
jgi:hypothetical protein